MTDAATSAATGAVTGAGTSVATSAAAGAMTGAVTDAIGERRADALAAEHGTVLLAGIVGSTAYGLSGPHSDVDRLGMYAAPTLSLLGLGTPRQSHVTSGPDITFHEAGKAARLILDGNPTASELLWLPDDLYETRTPLGEEMIALRSSFLARRKVRNAYLGYADQQLRKLLTRDPDPAGAAKTAKHARHLMRLANQGYELYTTGHVTVRLPDPERYLAFGEAVAANPEHAREFLAETEARFDRAKTVLPEESDTRVVEDWLLRVRKAFWDA
jgi:uncharacterized protein